MDNLFQLLIFLFVIYTIINAVFGKKKPKSSEREIPWEGSREVESSTSPRPQYSSGDVLEDLFGIKLPKTGDEYETHPPTNYPTDLEADLSEIYDQNKIEKSDLPNIDYDNLPSLETQLDTSLSEDQSVYEVKRSINQKTTDLNQKFRDQKTLRELFLISEILNKPKALRK